MNDDPIVEEVHQARAKLLAQHDGSLASYVEGLKQRKAEERPGRLVQTTDELHQEMMKLAS